MTNRDAGATEAIFDEVPVPIRPTLPFLAGGGEAGAIMRARDWATSPLGSPEAWPQSLQSMVGLLLGSKFPMFVAWGPELGFLYNDSYAEILGAKHPRALGSRFEEVWAEIWADISPLIEAALRGEASYQENLPLIINRQGYDEQTWFTFSYSPVRAESGQVAGMFCACTETTQTVLGERRLRESEASFHIMADSVDQMLWSTTPDGTHDYYNQRWYDFTGVPDGSTDGAAWNAMFHPEDQARAWTRWRHSLATGEPYHIEYRLRHRSGDYRWVIGRAQPVRDENGAIRRWYGTCTDVHEVKLAQEALAESEGRFRNMADHAPVMMWVTDPTGFCTYLNRAWYDFTGQSTAEAEGYGWLDATHPEDKQRAGDEFVAANAERRAFRVEYRLRRHDGAYRWAIDAASPRFGADGEYLGYVGSVIEIGDRRDMEDALRLSEARFRTLTNVVPAFVWLAGANGRINYLNDRWYEYTGQTAAEALADGWTGMLHPDDVEHTAATWAGAVAAGTSYEVECRYKRRDGAYRWYVARAEPLRDENGAVSAWFGTSSDIDERKRAEAARTAHSRVLELAIQDTPLAETLATLLLTVEQQSAAGMVGSILLLDRDGQHLRHGAAPSLPQAYNEAIDGIAIGHGVGSCGTAAAGKAPVFVSDIADDPLWADFRDLALSHGLRACWSIPILSAAGDLLGTFALYYGEPRTPLPTDLELVDLVTRSASLIIERDRAAQAVRDLNETLEARVAQEIRSRLETEEALRQAQKMETLGQLTGGVAHDFNNLLQIVTGNLEILQRNLPADQARLRRSADNAMRGAERAAILTQRLLAFARRQPLEPKRLNLNKLVGGMSELLHRTIGETVEIETVLAAGLWTVEADPNQLENAILNLAINARDAMPDGGKLTVETSNTDLDHAYSAQNTGVLPGQYVVVCVSDTGTGMAADTLDRVFEPFFTTKDVGRGTGLGLSMVYGFVKQSGGHVKIYSEPGEGTTVKLYMPRMTGTATEESAPLQGVAPEGTFEETILVCEDDDDVRAYSVEVLRELGYRVLEAHDGPSALRLLERQEGRVDLLFTDVVLPSGMTGDVLAEQARAVRPELKVLFTTGYARNAIVHHGRLDPGVELITKPFNYADLAARIRDLLDRRD